MAMKPILELELPINENQELEFNPVMESEWEITEFMPLSSCNPKKLGCCVPYCLI